MRGVFGAKPTLLPRRFVVASGHRRNILAAGSEQTSLKAAMTNPPVDALSSARRWLAGHFPVMRHTWLALVCISTFAAMQPVNARAEVSQVRVALENVRESFVAQGLTSISDRIVGYASTRLYDEVLIPQLTVTGVRSSDRFICVSISHINNLYRADFSFRNRGTSSVVKVLFESRFWHQLPSRSVGELAIEVYVDGASSCDGRKDEILPAGWGLSVPQEGYVLVNAGQSNSVRVQTAKQQAQDCRHVRDLMSQRQIVPVAYTHACPVSHTAARCRASLDLSIQRRDGPSLSMPERVRVRRHC
jgi:hypothetical protein